MHGQFADLLLLPHDNAGHVLQVVGSAHEPHLFQAAARYFKVVAPVPIGLLQVADLRKQDVADRLDVGRFAVLAQDHFGLKVHVGT